MRSSTETEIDFSLDLADLINQKLSGSVWSFVEITFASLLMTFLSLASAIYVMQVYDRVIPVNAISTLIVLTAGVVAAVVFEFFARQARAKLTERVSEVASLELQEALFRRVLNISSQDLQGSIGTLYSHLKQVEILINYRISRRIFLLVDMPLTLALVFFVWLIGGSVVLVPCVLVGILATLSCLFAYLLDREAETSNLFGNKKNAVAIEVLARIEAIQAHHAESRYTDTWRDLSSQAGGSDLRLKWINSLAANSAHLLQQLSYVLLVCVGSLLIINNELSIGALVACTIVGSRALGPISQLPQLLLKRKKYAIAYGSLGSLLTRDNLIENPDRLIELTEIRGDYALQNLEYDHGRNDSSTPALLVTDLKISAGEVIGVVGHIGSGKSTLLKLMAGLLRPERGSVSLDSVPIGEIKMSSLRDSVGFLPQHSSLISGTLYDNLTLGLRVVDGEKLARLCERLGLGRAVGNDRGGFSQQIPEDGTGLSGGETRLIGLVRVLMSDPAVLLLDEPTSGLDKDAEEFVIREIFEKNSGQRTIIVVSHKASTLKHVDKLLVMSAGRVAAFGPAEQIMKVLKSHSDVNK